MSDYPEWFTDDVIEVVECAAGEGFSFTYFTTSDGYVVEAVRTTPEYIDRLDLWRKAESTARRFKRQDYLPPGCHPDPIRHIDGPLVVIVRHVLDGWPEPDSRADR